MRKTAFASHAFAARLFCLVVAFTFITIASATLTGCGGGGSTGGTVTTPPPVKTTPVITWATPAPITYGTALSATQLNATANAVAGSYSYTLAGNVPAMGVVLPVGTATIYVAFAPTDTTDYNSVTANVSIIVYPATPEITGFTIAGGRYAVEDDFSNTFLSTVITCPNCQSGDVISTAATVGGTGTATLTTAETTIPGYIVFNALGYEPTFVTVSGARAGASGNAYSAAFLGSASQSTLAVSATTGKLFQIEQQNGQVDTLTTSGMSGKLFTPCTAIICETSSTQIAVDNTTGNIAYLWTGHRPAISVFNQSGTRVCDLTIAGMSFVSSVAANGGYMAFTDPTDNLVGMAKMDCTGSVLPISVAGQPWSVSMASGNAYVISRDKCANGIPCVTKIAVPAGTIVGSVDLTGVLPVSTLHGTTPYEGVYQVQAFGLSSTAAVLFMSDSSDGTVLILNTNTSSGAKMSVKYAVSVPELPIGIAAQESASVSTVWVAYLLANSGENIVHIGAINAALATTNYVSAIGACQTGLIGGFTADANGVHCAGGSTIAPPLVLQP